MHAIVVGCGRVGSALASELSGRGDDIVVIDRDAAAFGKLGRTFDGVTIRGEGTDEEVLLRAGIERADALAACSNSDSANIVTAEIARRMYRVARVAVRLYMPAKEPTVRLLGLDYVEDTRFTVRALLGRMVGDGQPLVAVRGGVELKDLVVGAEGHDRTVEETQVAGELRVCAVTRGADSFLPGPGFRLRTGDIVLAAVPAAPAGGRRSSPQG